MKIKSVSRISNQSKRYDIQTSTQNFFANGILVHNSMVHPVLINGEVVFKTKKSFTSAEAIAATEFLKADSEKYNWVRALMALGFTPIFEWTSPRFPIVLVYEKDELTLLQVRNNITGEYRMDFEDINCPFPIVENLIKNFQAPVDFDDQGQVLEHTVSWEMLHAAAMERTRIEGWIAQADDGRMWKIKTKWYVSLHRQVVFSRWRDLARSVVMDQSDDLKAAFSMVGRSIEPILHVERVIKQRIENARATVEAIVAEGHIASTDMKSMALRWKGHELFGQIMSSFRGKGINWMEWYEKFCLEQDFSNEVIPSQ